MVQQGQTIELARRGSNGERLWAYRYRTGGRDSKRIQRGGFASEQDGVARSSANSNGFDASDGSRAGSRSLSSSRHTWSSTVQPVTIEKLSAIS
jgi:hypothetical protein